MTSEPKLQGGNVHKLPADLKAALLKDKRALKAWQDITPLARNEWICWVISGKKAETRHIRIEKAWSKLASGMRRPCCWSGCIHRDDKPLSRAQQFVLSKQKSK